MRDFSWADKEYLAARLAACTGVILSFAILLGVALISNSPIGDDLAKCDGSGVSCVESQALTPQLGNAVLVSDAEVVSPR